MDVASSRSSATTPTSRPNTGGTFGSSSIAIAGPRLRSAAAPARQSLLELASEHLGVPAACLTVSRGVVSGGGRSVSYGELVGGRLLSVALPAPMLAPGAPPSKPVSAIAWSGVSRMPRRRHPRQGRRAPTSTSTASACPGCCTAGSCVRSARAPTATARSTGIVVGRRALDRAASATRESCAAATSSASSPRASTTRSRRPRGCGRLRATRRRHLRQRQPLRADARARRGRAGAGAHPGRAGDPDGALAAAAARRCARATPTTTRATCRSARAAPSPT